MKTRSQKMNAKDGRVVLSHVIVHSKVDSFVDQWS